MSYYFVARPDGTISHTGQCPESMVPLQAQAPDIAVVGTCDLHADQYNHQTQALEKRTITLAEQWRRVRFERTTLLNATDSMLAALLLPDSFPSLTAAEKQAKTDAILAYRQALRDVTTQSDPQSIAWPVTPV